MELSKLHDLYAGERCFIIGNGPSLNLHDLSDLKNEFTFAVNGIFYKTDEMGFRPTFYVVEDSHVIEDNLRAINQYEAPFKLFPECYADRIESAENVCFFQTDEAYYQFRNELFGVPRFATNASQGIVSGHTVTYTNLQLAYYFGFTEVYLIGMDFSYKVPESTLIDGCDFTSQEDDPNHFHKDYFGKGKKWHDPRLDKVALMFKQARRVYEMNHRAVYNATVGGKLETFPRVAYEKLISQDNDTQPVKKQTQTEHLLSVVLLARSMGMDLECTLSSLESLQEHLPDLSVMMVCDDAADQVCVEKLYSLEKDWITVIPVNGHGGECHALNLGIQQTNSTYLLFLKEGDQVSDPVALTQELYTRGTELMFPGNEALAEQERQALIKSFLMSLSPYGLCVQRALIQRTVDFDAHVTMGWGYTIFVWLKEARTLGPLDACRTTISGEAVFSVLNVETLGDVYGSWLKLLRTLDNDDLFELYGKRFLKVFFAQLNLVLEEIAKGFHREKRYELCRVIYNTLNQSERMMTILLSEKNQQMAGLFIKSMSKEAVLQALDSYEAYADSTGVVFKD